jgi:5-methylcytosine-specific restriction endonuclease McrA
MATKKTRQARADHQGPHRQAYEKARQIVIKTGTVCAICGLPVDKKLKWPDPMSATADHIIPISKGGHPSDLANLQLTHYICNRLKSDKLIAETQKFEQKKEISNRDLPQTLDWASYRSKG